MKKTKFQCPCCDYFSLGDRGQYTICRVCFWEDDGNDFDSLDKHSGPNHMTLREARRNFVEVGACDQAMLKNVLSADKRSKFAYQQRSS